jgi:hypothetical protein
LRVAPIASIPIRHFDRDPGRVQAIRIRRFGTASGDLPFAVSFNDEISNFCHVGRPLTRSFQSTAIKASGAWRRSLGRAQYPISGAPPEHHDITSRVVRQ